MSSVSVNGVRIEYQLIGQLDPGVIPIVFTPGGQNGINHEGYHPLLMASLDLSRYAALLWDRRNCEASGVSYKPGDEATPEPEQQAHDLKGLMDHLGIGKALLLGQSSGSRLSLIFAKLFPHRVLGLVLFNLTGGRLAAQTLAHYYYAQYAKLARDYGMKAVASTPHYADMCRMNGETRQHLLQTDPEVFAQCMEAWAAWVMSTQDNVIIGLSDEELRVIPHRALVLHTFQPNDGMHTPSANERLSRLLPGCEGFVASSVERQEEWLPRVVHFVKQFQHGQGGEGGLGQASEQTALS